MARKPRIPMLSTQLPQQRLYLVNGLPERPANWSTKNGNQAVAIAPPAMPRSARYIGQVEWAWSPMHMRIDASHLTPFCLSSDDLGLVDFLASLADQGEDLAGDVPLEASYGLQFGVTFADALCDPTAAAWPAPPVGGADRSSCPDGRERSRRWPSAAAPILSETEPNCIRS